MSEHVADRLADAVARRESQVVLGLDPDPARLWPQAVAGVPDHGTAAHRAGAAVAAHCAALIDAAGPACVAVKLQLACFERLGACGWAALEATVARARGVGLFVLADGKRGDVPVTAAAYAQALFTATPTPFGDVPGLGADLATANPLLGEDALVALVDGARAAGAGVIALVRTSNPGAADVQDLVVDGAPLWERLAALAAGLGRPGPRSGLADIGAVLGATRPEHLARARELMPFAPFLLPGIGAQGGGVEDLMPAFVPGRAGGLVTASRSIAFAHETAGGQPARAARAEAERLRASAWAMG
ncbi:MAG: orotidine-5'-phosphate decarboxylase [Solirubrobacterales bacterium]|nr:orotidine-5'-phosphate decarboxylase [Solirubrobacterales bacterium]